MYLLYVLRSQKTGELYKGITNNFNRRIKEHNSGKSISTRGRRPWKLVYVEQFKNREDARKREKFLKSGEGRELLKNLLNDPR